MSFKANPDGSFLYEPEAPEGQRPHQGLRPPAVPHMRGRVFSLAADDQDGIQGILADPTVLNSLESDASFIWHRPEDDSVRAVRDAVGATPVFYAKTPRGWALSFSLATLIPLLDPRPTPREDTLYDFLATHYRYIFRDPKRTFHEGVWQLPAGCELTLDGAKAEVSPWLDLGFDPEPSTLRLDEAADRYLSMLRENVSLRLSALAASGGFAFTVSSGLDSSTVACLASELMDAPLECWYVGYSMAKGSPYDETRGVRALTGAKGWPLHPLDLSLPDLAKDASDLMDRTLAPLATVNWLASAAMAKQAAEAGASFLVSGLGGDESLAGEFDHFMYFFADLYSDGQHTLLEKETEAWIRLHDHPVFRKSRETRDNYFKRLINFKTGEIRVDLIRYSQNRHWFDEDWVKSLETRIPPPLMPRPYPYFLSNRLYQEMIYETSPPTLWSENLASSAYWMRGVFPMASPRLFRFALSLPGTYKYEGGLTKMLLRRSTKGLLPEPTRLNPVKVGFNTPLDQWLMDPAFADSVLDRINSSPLPNTGWLIPCAADKIIAEHRSGARNHMMLVWQLLNAALFLEKNSR
ncbi:MAG: asparagine synthase [Deltaproteobacteria bacterium]|jgi:asparagine synthase (glutamine-hydrolysing)|nr:asparagine synthase [Deltaproteobacteria bacterium]